ncbi:MAG: HEAT repeat domain-containing protein, partial [Nitrospira sp.]|nr:HEAT repeat domain-containing protein [Nitrospira sp.]
MTEPTRHDEGPISPAWLIVIIGLIVAGVWIWKRLSLDTQDYIVDQAVPMAAIGLVITILLLIPINAFRRRRARSQERCRLLGLFERATVQEQKLDLAFALLENNDYRIDGLDSAVPALKELFETTLQRALGDKQHRIRGMAASHLGALQDRSVIPLLVKALEDDHAYVRSCAALGLGRLR